MSKKCLAVGVVMVLVVFAAISWRRVYMPLLSWLGELRPELASWVGVEACGEQAKMVDTEIFGAYQAQAQQKLATMTLDEKISQTLLVRYPDMDGVSILADYQFGGYLFFAKDFADRSRTEVQAMMAELQDVAKVPILTAVDEEGGIVVRVSNNSALAKAPFASPSEVYAQGGMAALRQNTLEKSRVLSELGINLNLAPVVDIAQSPSDYMFARSLRQDAQTTAEFAETVITASQGTGVSYTLKHFPGYGNNIDTHKSVAQDTRAYRQIWQEDLLPFRAGIQAGAEAVLVSHNIVTSVDLEMPASLSADVHKLLRDKLGFSGVIVTDDIAMAAVDGIANPAAEAILAGNDLIITTDYEASIAEIKTALVNGKISAEAINAAAGRVLAWKYYKGLLAE